MFKINMTLVKTVLQTVTFTDCQTCWSPAESGNTEINQQNNESNILQQTNFWENLMFFLSLFVDADAVLSVSTVGGGFSRADGGVWIPTVFDIQQIKKKLNDI